MELTIELHLPGSSATTLTLNREMIKVGSFKAHIELSADVARTHALIECRDHENIVFVDMGCGTGTKINGKQINKSSRFKLRLGDIIQIGDCKIIIQRTKVGDDERVHTPKEESPESDSESDSQIVIESVEEHWRTIGMIESTVGGLQLMKMQLKTCESMNEDVAILREEIGALVTRAVATLEKARRAK